MIKLFFCMFLTISMLQCSDPRRQIAATPGGQIFWNAQAFFEKQEEFATAPRPVFHESSWLDMIDDIKCVMYQRERQEGSLVVVTQSYSKLYYSNQHGQGLFPKRFYGLVVTGRSGGRVVVTDYFKYYISPDATPEQFQGTPIASLVAYMQKLMLGQTVSISVRAHIAGNSPEYDRGGHCVFSRKDDGSITSYFQSENLSQPSFSLTPVTYK